MPHSILDAPAPEPAIYERIGKIAAEWGWVEMLLGEMLAYFCRADPGSMYVITHNVSGATITDWLRTLTEIKVKDGNAAQVVLDLLNEIDDARAERNTIVHGAWRAANDPGFAWVNTFRWDRKEVARSELWSIADLEATAANMINLQLMLANLGIKMGFLRPKP